MYFNRRLWIFTQGVRQRIWGAVAIGVLSSAFGIARLALLGWLLGLIFVGAPWNQLLLAGGLAAGAILLRGWLEYGRIMVAHRTAAKVQYHLRALLYDKVVALGPARLGLTRTGDVLISLVDGIEHLEVYFGQYLPQLFVAAITPALIFAFVAWLDLPVALVLLAAALITLVAPAAFHLVDSRNSLARAKAYGDFAAEFLDSVQGLATLKAFGQSGARARILAAKAHELFRTTMWVLATNSLSRGITDCGIAIGAAAALGLGAYRVQQGAMSLEILLVILLLGVEVFRPLRDLRGLLHSGMLAQSAAGKVLDLLDATPLVAEPPAPAADANLPATLEFDEVRFAYPGGRGEAHRGVSFTVAAGERIGIVGPSGSGKSSIVRLLLRLYDPQSGTIRLGGRDLKSLSFAELRCHLAVVNQDTYLFHGTVEDNLRFGKPEASHEELEAAARAANAHDFIMALPEGYRTVVGERGIKLSGGQRQRIAIARALLRNAPILVLDEALSAVDAENEAVIQEALDRLMTGRTTLILAHRLSSVIDADRILVLDEGRVVEQGAHGALMAQDGIYHALMAEQAKDRARSPSRETPPALQSRPLFLEDKTEPSDAAPAHDILAAEGLGWGAALRHLLGFARPWRGRLAMTFGFGVTRVLAFIAVGLVSALAVAAVKQGEPIFGLMIALAILAPAAGILHWLESWVAHDMAFRMLAEMRVALFRKLDRLAPAYLVRRRTGDLVAMATNDVELVEYFFAHTIAPAVVAVLVPVTALVGMAMVHWALALTLMPFLAIVALSPFVLRARADRLASRDREALGELNAHMVDNLQGLGEVIAFQQEARRRQGFLALVERHQAVRLPFFGDLTLQQALVEVMTALGGLAVALVGGWLAASGVITALYLPLLTLLAMAAFLPISEIADIGRQLADTLGATRRLHAVHSEPVPVTDGAKPAPARANQGAEIAFEEVTFAYPGGAGRALDGVDLSLPAGQTVALVGRSGAGKTTLAHLLLRFWDPDQGRILLDGQDLRDYALDDLRQEVALVAQDTYLFNDSLGANIRIAKPDASEAVLTRALERAALSDFVASLPDGLATRVGERGMALSGGQRQRVAIARAFLRDAPVLVLDEATSHLDALSERLVHRALGDLMADRTTLVIAHRLSTVRAADRIVVLDDGRVVESGSHHELLAAGGLYAHLVERQLGAGTPRQAAE
ncbi:MAG: thiol reductant ABC exporter subunit CydC [Pseudomonadota bacterium]